MQKLYRVEKILYSYNAKADYVFGCPTVRETVLVCDLVPLENIMHAF